MSIDNFDLVIAVTTSVGVRGTVDGPWITCTDLPGQPGKYQSRPFYGIYSGSDSELCRNAERTRGYLARLLNALVKDGNLTQGQRVYVLVHFDELPAVYTKTSRNDRPLACVMRDDDVVVKSEMNRENDGLQELTQLAVLGGVPSGCAVSLWGFSHTGGTIHRAIEGKTTFDELLKHLQTGDCKQEFFELLMALYPVDLLSQTIADCDTAVRFICGIKRSEKTTLGESIAKGSDFISKRFLTLRPSMAASHYNELARLLGFYEPESYHVKDYLDLLSDVLLEGKPTNGEIEELNRLEQVLLRLIPSGEAGASSSGSGGSGFHIWFLALKLQLFEILGATPETKESNENLASG
jgi:hypothetical protein